MADLATTYMGIPLRNPVIVGASGMTASIDGLQQLESAGAGAVVLKSLFEEQIQLERFKFDEDLHKYDHRHAEMITTAPSVHYAGPAAHLAWVRKAKQAVRIPVIASLNAVNPAVWVDYAKRMEDTGIDGLECNLFASPRHPGTPGAAVEDDQVHLAAALTDAVGIPVSLKLSPFYSNMLHLVPQLDAAGVKGFVLFNRLFEPDINIHTEELISPMSLSHDTDYRLPLRYAALLEGTVRGDICCASGIFTAATVVKMILAGARVVQTVSALFRQGIAHLPTLLKDTVTWMEGKRYATLADFRGKLSQRNVKDPSAYTRAQYAALLMNPEVLIRNSPTL